MTKNKLLLLLALLMTAATGAWAAAENENIIFNNLGLANGYDLTSATLTVGNINLDFAKGTGTSTPAFYTSGGGTVRLYKGNTMSVDAVGATITKIVFTYASEVTPEFSTGSYNSSTKTWEGEATTLTVTNAYTTNTQIRITSMDVYYSAASGYTVSLNDGTENPTTWTASTDGTNFGALPIGGLKGDGSETVTLKYNGRLKVKSVTATSDAAPAVKPAAAVTTAPTATAAIIEAGTTTALVEAGVADGGTLMYAVTTTNTKPTSTDGFSATRPTAEGRAAGTYYVWFYVKADADHSDSEIAGPVSVTVTSAPTTVTWNSSNIGGSYPNALYVSGTYQSYTKEGITLSANSDMNGAEWRDFGDESMNGITFQVNESGGFTFTAPTGKKFTKIEMTLNGPGGWSSCESLGTGWAYADNFDPMTMYLICKVTWTGSASTVNLLTDADHFSGEYVKSIVFYLSE